MQSSSFELLDNSELWIGKNVEASCHVLSLPFGPFLLSNGGRPWKNSDTVFGVAASSKKGGATSLLSVREDRPANETGFCEINDGSTNGLIISFKEGHCVNVRVMNLRVSEQATWMSSSQESFVIIQTATNFLFNWLSIFLSDTYWPYGNVSQNCPNLVATLARKKIIVRAKIIYILST